MDSEEWREVAGYRGVYLVSSHGEIKGFVKNNKPSGGHLLKQRTRAGHPSVNLVLNGVETCSRVCFLVARAFIPPERNSVCVGHKDGDTANNRADNLFWRPRDFAIRSQTEPGEIWAPVASFEDRYLVSSLGRVGALDAFVKNQYRYGGVLSPRVTPDGYYQIVLWGAARAKTLRVHRLVAAAFLKKKDGCDVVNHINNIGTDNRVENLEWTTNIGNARHARAILPNWSPRGSKHHAARLTEELVSKIRAEYLAGNFDSVGTARRLGVSYECIYGVISGSRWRHVPWPDHPFSKIQEVRK